MDLTFEPIANLVTMLQEAGMDAAQDPSDLNLPGVWVTVEGIDPVTLDGSWQLDTVLFLIAPDIDHGRAAELLAELFNQLTALGVTPDGIVRPQGVIMPGDPTPLPALRFPLHLFT